MISFATVIDLIDKLRAMSKHCVVNKVPRPLVHKAHLLTTKARRPTVIFMISEISSYCYLT